MFKVYAEKCSDLYKRLENADNENMLHVVLKNAISFERSSFFKVMDIINELKKGNDFHTDESIIYLIEKGLVDWEKNKNKSSDDITVTITGFEKIEEAEEFCNWYSGQGESDSSIWFDSRVKEGVIDKRSMLEESFIKTSESNIEMTLKMYK